MNRLKNIASTHEARPVCHFGPGMIQAGLGWAIRVVIVITGAGGGSWTKANLAGLADCPPALLGGCKVAWLITDADVAMLLRQFNADGSVSTVEDGICGGISDEILVVEFSPDCLN
jgi:hypothetical protein